MQRKTIGRNHVKADPRKQHDAASFRPCVPRLKRLEDGDLAGDVEVVDAGAQAGFDERLGGILKGPAQFNTTATSFSARSNPGGIVEPEDAVPKAHLACNTVEFSAVPPGDYRCCARARRLARDMLADVAGRSLDH